MRKMNTNGGLTRGRGFNEKSLARWIGSMPSRVEIRRAIEQYCDARTVTSEQYVEMRHSRQSRDADDVKKLVSWLIGIFYIKTSSCAEISSVDESYLVALYKAPRSIVTLNNFATMDTTH